MYTKVHRTSEEQTIKYTLFQRTDNEMAGAISFAAPVVYSLPKEKSIFKSCLQGIILISLCGTHFLVISII